MCEVMVCQSESGGGIVYVVGAVLELTVIGKIAKDFVYSIIVEEILYSMYYVEMN